MEARNLKEIIHSQASRNKKIGDAFIKRGSFHIKVFDKHGKFKDEFDVDNLITDEGAKNDFDVYFRSGTQITAWYIGLIDNAGIAGGPAVTDVMNSHAGWGENQAYDEATRVAWSPTAASGTGTGTRQVTNTSPAVFTINVDATVIYGIFITSGSVKGGTTGKLWSAAAFTSTRTFDDDDVLNVTYTLKG